VFTTATRSAVEKLQQQYGLPMTGIWGSLERGVFDTNARVLTAPPASAAALLPPDYNRTTSNVYAKAVGAVPAAAPAPAKAATSSGAVAIPGDVTGIAVCASAGFLTAAVVSKASAARRARALQPPGPPAGAVVASAFETVVAAARGLGGAPRDRGGSQNGYYDELGYFHEEPPRGPPPAHQATRSAEPGWFAPDAARPEGHDDLTLYGGYPAPPPPGLDVTARGPVRPGDRRRGDADASAPEDVPAHARGYHPAFSPGGPAFDPDRVAPPPPPPATPPPPGAGHRGKRASGAGASASPRGYGGWGEDLDLMGRDGAHRDGAGSLDAARDARDRAGGGGSQGPMASGFRSSNGAARPASRTPASVPPYGDWGGGGGGSAGFDSRVRAGPAAVPEFGASDAVRGLGASAQMPNLAKAGLGNGPAAAATATATATMAPPEPPSVRRRREAAMHKSPGLLSAIGDGLRNLAGRALRRRAARTVRVHGARAARARAPGAG
jgi:hypothetical protein